MQVNMKKKVMFSILSVISIIFMVLIQQACKQKTKNEVASTSQEFEFKDKLSDYAFFTGTLKELNPQEGLVHYDLSSALFTDYAVKDRFIYLPQGTNIEFTADGPLNFPDSTIIIKNFAYMNVKGEKIMIETRLLAKDPKDHQWKVMNYLWNDEQTDAVKHIRGAKLPITLIDDQGQEKKTTYLVPNTNDCKRCHINESKIIPIGPKARNLNFTVQGHEQNQLEKWSEEGIITGLPAIHTVSALPVWTNLQKHSLEERARAYLDINCAHCHIKGGDAYNTGLFLDYEETDPTRLGVGKMPVSAGGGAGGLNYDIIPGDPDNSILFYRMNSTEAGTAMPELARTLIHDEGVALIKEWIAHMPKK